MDFAIHQSFNSDNDNLLRCYDNANELYLKDFRAPGTIQIMQDVLENNQTFHVLHNNHLIGWISFHKIGDISILQGLYVMSDWQGKGISNQLIEFYFKKCKKDKIKYSLLSYLNCAEWAENFYKKFDYQHINHIGNEINDVMRNFINKNQTKFSDVLYKAFES